MQGISWKWVGIGAVLMVGLNFLWSNVLLEPVGVPLLVSLGLYGGLIVFALIIALLSFFVGGVIVGRLSPSSVVKEPAVASVAAIIINLIITIAQTGQFPGLLGIAIAFLISYGLGFAGGKVGEMLKGKHKPAPAPGGF